jgi:hypothetical protein
MKIEELEALFRELHEKAQSLIIIGKAYEGRRLINVRFIGQIKDIEERNRIVFYKFRPLLIPFFVSKNNNEIRVILPTKGEKSYEAVLRVLEIDNGTLYTEYPKKIFNVRSLRIEPSINKPINLYLLIYGEPSTLAEVINISESGICFVTERELKVNGDYGFTIILPDNLGIITCYGEIRYKLEDRPGFFRYGAKLKIHPKDQAIINRYIMQREKEILNMLKVI